MGTKKSFIVYYSWRSIFNRLSNEQKGVLITAIFDYVIDKTVTDFSDLALGIAFDIVKDTLDRDGEKYKTKCLKNAENAKKRWQNNANACDTMRSNANYADNDNDNDIDNDIDNDNDNDIDTDKDNNTSFSTKTVCGYSEDFLVFLKEYPKKVGKGEAFKQWKKAKLSEGDKKDILTALKWQKKSDRWRNSNVRYIPNHDTYSSQRRWADEPSRAEPDYTDPSRYTKN